jgi:hypothetical protein
MGRGLSLASAVALKPEMLCPFCNDMAASMSRPTSGHVSMWKLTLTHRDRYESRNGTICDVMSGLLSSAESRSRGRLSTRGAHRNPGFRLHGDRELSSKVQPFRGRPLWHFD